jgi:hypothetical protein
MQNKLAKIFGIFLLFLFLGGLFIYLFNNDPLPEVVPSEEANALASKMLKAVHYEAYQNTRFIKWSYQEGRHQYNWDKKLGLVEVRWDEVIANINLNDPIKSKISKKGNPVVGESKKELVEKAIKYFNNDSFWLVAPFKIYDKGTSRGLVTLDDGSNGLLVTYSQGGTTPGDSYLWTLDENGLPESFKMWVQVLPLKGLEASWENWEEMESGVLLPQLHRIGPIKLDMGTVEAYN